MLMVSRPEVHELMAVCQALSVTFFGDHPVVPSHCWPSKTGPCLYVALVLKSACIYARYLHPEHENKLLPSAHVVMLNMPYLDSHARRRLTE
jgi:hypothetical protein